MREKKVLNVGGNSRQIELPPQYEKFQKVWLDIDPKVEPDLLCDARHLADLKPQQFDAVYCSHNLEHYYRHEVPIVLDGFLHVLREDGFAHIRVPDLAEVMRIAVAQDLDVEDVIYDSAAGPIMLIDVLYGFSEEIERTGEDFFCHKTGFTEKSLSSALRKSGFQKIFTVCNNLEIIALAFKQEPSPLQVVDWGLPRW